MALSWRTCRGLGMARVTRWPLMRRWPGLATQTSKSAVTQLMRIAWRTVGSIIARVWGDTDGLHDRFADLCRQDCRPSGKSVTQSARIQPALGCETVTRASGGTAPTGGQR